MHSHSTENWIGETSQRLVTGHDCRNLPFHSVDRISIRPSPSHPSYSGRAGSAPLSRNKKSPRKGAAARQVVYRSALRDRAFALSVFKLAGETIRTKSHSEG